MADALGVVSTALEFVHERDYVLARDHEIERRVTQWLTERGHEVPPALSEEEYRSRSIERLENA